MNKRVVIGLPFAAQLWQWDPRMTYLNFAARIGLVLVACGTGAAAQAGTIAEWNFGTLATTAPDNTPAATNGTQATNSATTGTSLGMTNTYVESNGNDISTTNDDITNDTNSTIGNGNVWRIRGGGATSGNGWSINAPEYSQGAQFTTTTAGYDDIVLSFSWASTKDGIANMQMQYNTNVTNASGWTNVGSLLTATVGNMCFRAHR
jgi:hypothetical protein